MERKGDSIFLTLSSIVAAAMHTTLRNRLPYAHDLWLRLVSIDCRVGLLTNTSLIGHQYIATHEETIQTRHLRHGGELEFSTCDPQIATHHGRPLMASRDDRS